MGVFNWPVRISSMDGQHSREIDGRYGRRLYDAACKPELGIAPVQTSTFEMADGRHVEMDIGRAWATIGRKRITLVYSAVMMEGLRLAVDPSTAGCTHSILY